MFGLFRHKTKRVCATPEERKDFWRAREIDNGLKTGKYVNTSGAGIMTQEQYDRTYGSKSPEALHAKRVIAHFSSLRATIQSCPHCGAPPPKHGTNCEYCGSLWPDADNDILLNMGMNYNYSW